MEKAAMMVVAFALLAGGCGGSNKGDDGSGGSSGAAGDGGAGGVAGTAGRGGSGGRGGVAGTGGVGGLGGGGLGGGGSGGVPECEVGDDCADGNECTEDLCTDGVCSNRARADDTDCDANGLSGFCKAGVCVADPAWGAAEKISPSNAFATSPRADSDRDGNTIVVWQQEDNAGTRSVWARRFTRSDGWGTAERISDGLTDTNRARVAVDASGSAVATWYQFEREVTPLLTIHNIWAARYTPADGWMAPEIIENNAGNAVEPEVAANSDGVHMIVWTQHPDGNGHRDIWGRKYDFANGWDIARAVEVNGENSQNPKVAVDAAGNAVAVWNQASDIWAGSYTLVNGWGTSQPLTDNAAAGTPDVAVDADGNAIAVWGNSNCSTTCYAWAANYTSGGAWGAPATISGQDAFSHTFAAAFDSAGGAMVLWSRSNDIWNNRYSPQSGWGSAALVEQSPAGTSDPSFGFDADGNAQATWYDSQSGIQTASFMPSAGWSSYMRMDEGIEQPAAPHVAVDPVGRVTVVWHQYDGMNFSVWARRYE